MEKELKLAICKAVLCSPESLTQPEIEACEDCLVTQKIERAFRDAGWLPPGQSFPLTRKQFLALPMEVRREILAKQAEAERIVSEQM